MLTSDMCLAYRNNIKATMCKKTNNHGGLGWAPNMQDCFYTYAHDGYDLDANEIIDQGNGCAWTKWIYFEHFGYMPKTLCGEDSDLRGPKGEIGKGKGGMGNFRP